MLYYRVVDGVQRGEKKEKKRINITEEEKNNGRGGVEEAWVSHGSRFLKT